MFGSVVKFRKFMGAEINNEKYSIILLAKLK